MPSVYSTLRTGLLLVPALLGGAHMLQQDCSQGCPLTADLVCGANGLTFMGECLALCSGTTVAQTGACPPPAVLTANNAALAAASADDHPLAGTGGPKAWV
jgi:hypothetical protein